MSALSLCRAVAWLGGRGGRREEEQGQARGGGAGGPGKAHSIPLYLINVALGLTTAVNLL